VSLGGYPGISGRVLRHNTPADIRNALLNAGAYLLAAEPDLVKAMAAVNGVKGLGSPSFASKHLTKVLAPATVPGIR
jgi:hypothetical protein